MLILSSRDWPEDFAHENGNYACVCVTCKAMFHGYKRRVVCKQCHDAATVNPPAEPAAVESNDDTLEKMIDAITPTLMEVGGSYEDNLDANKRLLRAFAKQLIEKDRAARAK